MHLMESSAETSGFVRIIHKTPHAGIEYFRRRRGLAANSAVFCVWCKWMIDSVLCKHVVVGTFSLDAKCVI